MQGNLLFREILLLTVLVAVFCSGLTSILFLTWIKNVPSSISGREQYHKEIVNKVNTGDYSWEAEFNRFGALEPQCGDATEPQPRSYFEPETDSNLPPHFDSREKWPYCTLLHQPSINQGECGSCWAIGSTAAMSDRICIVSNGTVQPRLSAWDVVTCNVNGTENIGEGCIGGWFDRAYEYWASHGVVTGGKYGSTDGCKPYPKKAYCGSPCPTDSYNINGSICQKVCGSWYPKAHKEDKFYGTNIYIEYIEDWLPYWWAKTEQRDVNATEAKYWSGVVKNVQNALVTSGPVSGAFMVYEDIFHYASGIYQRVTGHTCYGHVVKILGWGRERGINYWIIANSWGESWGQLGFGKITMGHFSAYAYGDAVLQSSAQP